MTPELITFDCYGTLVDWEGGIEAAIRSEFTRAGDLSREELLTAFHEIQDELKTSEYRSYRELLAQVGEGVASRWGWPLLPERREFIAESIARWTPFEDTSAALLRLREAGHRLGILSNIDNDLLAATRSHFPVEFDLLVTAEDLCSYKPSTPHFDTALDEVGGDPSRMLHVAQSLFHDVRTAAALGIPVVWVNRKGEPAPADISPVAETRDVAEAVEWLQARVGAV